MVPTEDDRDCPLSTGRERRRGDCRHLAVQDHRQQISDGKSRAATPLTLVNDELFGLEADMAPARDLEDSFRVYEGVGRGHRWTTGPPSHRE